MRCKSFVGVTVGLCIVFLAHSASETAHAQSHPGKAMFKIVGGTKAPAGAWPWMVGIVRVPDPTPDNYNDQYCGGALIDSKWVLTAAHCVQLQSSGSEFQVLIGLDSLLETGTRINVTSAHVHPGYYNSDGKMVPDIALLELETDAIQTPISLYRGSSSLEGINATIIGWGAINPDGSGAPYDLMQVQIPIVSYQTCNTAYGGSITSWELCAGYAAGGADSCSGDSGGPMMIFDGGAWKLAGITSWGDGCAQPNRYGVYAKISSLVSWIDNIMHPPLAGDYNGDGVLGLDDSIGILQLMTGIRH